MPPAGGTARPSGTGRGRSGRRGRSGGRMGGERPDPKAAAAPPARNDVMGRAPAVGSGSERRWPGDAGPAQLRAARERRCSRRASWSRIAAAAATAGPLPPNDVRQRQGPQQRRGTMQHQSGAPGGPGCGDPSGRGGQAQMPHEQKLSLLPLRRLPPRRPVSMKKTAVPAATTTTDPGAGTTRGLAAGYGPGHRDARGHGRARTRRGQRPSCRRCTSRKTAITRSRRTRATYAGRQDDRRWPR